MKLLRLKLLGFVGQLCCPTFGLVCGPSGPVLHHAAVKVLALAPLLLIARVVIVLRITIDLGHSPRVR